MPVLSNLFWERPLVANLSILARQRTLMAILGRIVDEHFRGGAGFGILVYERPLVVNFDKLARDYCLVPNLSRLVCESPGLPIWADWPRSAPWWLIWAEWSVSTPRWMIWVDWPASSPGGLFGQIGHGLAMECSLVVHFGRLVGGPLVADLGTFASKILLISHFSVCNDKYFVHGLYINK